MSDAIGKVSEYISHSEDQRTSQIKMMSQLIKMLDMGTQRNPKIQEGIQTDLTLIAGQNQWVSLTSDKDIDESKLTSLGLIFQDTMKQLDTPAASLTNEELIKQFSYIMTEKVKKDQLDRKLGKAK